MKAYDLKATWEVEIVVQGPFDFSRTVAKPAGWHWATPGEVFQAGTLWSGTYLNGIPIGLKMSAEDRKISATVYAQVQLNDNEKRSLLRDMRLGLGADDDLQAFYAVACDDDILSVTVKDLYGMRVGRLDDVFGRVILAITLQMAPLKRSEQMMAKLLAEYGTVIAFDDREVVLWPQPSDIARLEPAELRRSVNLGYRAERLVKAAQYLVDHPLSLHNLLSLPELEAMKKVIEVPGIGSYSARLILGRSSAPVDVWSVVILSELLLARTPKHPRKEIEDVKKAMTDRWGEWSWVAFVYILNDLPQLARVYNLSRIT
ncbi:MAG: DNA-3-methyladenine glycosylase family protein [Halobacteriota archaeon]